MLFSTKFLILLIQQFFFRLWYLKNCDWMICGDIFVIDFNFYPINLKKKKNAGFVFI